MDPIATTAGGVAPGGVPASAPGTVGLASATEAIRAKWREKSRRARERMRARLAGQPLPETPPAPGPMGGSAGDPVAPTPGGPVPGVGPVPWTPDLVRPFFETVVPEVEKLAVQQLVSTAQRIGDPALVAEVKKDAAWNPMAKATVIAQGPQQFAELMNSLGVDAKHAGIAIFGSAVTAIWLGHKQLLARLEEMEKRHGPAPKPEPSP